MATNGISLDNLNIQITVSANAAKEALDDLAQSISGAASALPHAFDAFRTFTEELRDLANAAVTTNESLRGVVNSLQQIQGQTGNTFQALTQTTDAMSQLAESCDTVQRAGRAVEENLAPSVRKPLIDGEKLERLFHSISNICEKIAFGSAKLLGKGLSAAFNSAKGVVENVTAKIGNLFSSIKRIAFYRLIRSSIKMVTQALKEGVENLVAWDRTIQNTSKAAQTMDSLKSTAHLLTNTLGAMAMPIIQLLVPALNAIADAAITAANAINQFFRSLQGYGTYIKAIRGEVGGLSGAAKELKRVLFGFDELNVLPSQSGSGGGTSYENMFEEVDIEDSFFGKLRKLIKSKSWGEVGKELGKKVNSLVSEIKAEELGRKLGEKIQAAVDLMTNLITTIDFVSIGGKVATFLNNILYSVNWQQVGELLISKILWLFDFGIGFIEKLDWFKVGQSLGGFLSGIIGRLTDWIRNTDWFTLGTKIVDGFINMVKGMKTEDIIKALWELVKAVLYAVYQLALALANKLVQKLIDVVPDWVFDLLGTSKAAVKLTIDASFTMAANDKAWINKIDGILAQKSDFLQIMSKAKANYDYLPAYKKFAEPVTSSIRGYASGGFIPNVNTGSLFIAGESGAELVMNAPGGTEVMNGNQVEEAMTNANTEVINAIYAMANMVVGAVNNKDFDVYMDAQKVGKSVSQYQYNVARQYGG